MAKQFWAVNAQGQSLVYSDRKKFWWLLSLAYPILPLAGLALYAYTGHTMALALPILLSHVCMPLIDYVVGEDVNNPPEEVVPELEQDRYYRWLTWITVPLHFVTLLACAWWVGTNEMSWGAILLLAYVAGMHSGLGLNTGHELGHKYTSTEQWLARLVLAVPVYGHFTVEHGQGHHRSVATPEDHASSRICSPHPKRSGCLGYAQHHAAVVCHCGYFAIWTCLCIWLGHGALFNASQLHCLVAADIGQLHRALRFVARQIAQW
jgi:alkane 1-monooxygenase